MLLKKPIITKSSQSGLSVVRVAPADGGPPQYFVPFLNGWVDEAIALDEHRVLVLSIDPEVVLYDLRKKAITARRTIKALHDRIKSPCEALLLDDDHLLVRKQKGKALVVLGLEDLQPVHSIEYIFKKTDHFWSVEDYETGIISLNDKTVTLRHVSVTSMAMTTDGLITLNETVGRGRLQVPIIRFSKDFKSATVEVIDELEAEAHHDFLGSNPLRWLSPTGRYALRPSWTPAYFPAAGKKWLNWLKRTSDEPDYASHPDYKGDEALGLCVEVWDLGSKAKLIASPIVIIPSDETYTCFDDHRQVSLDLALWSEHTNNGHLPVTCQYVEAGIMRTIHFKFLENIKEILWDPDESGFWVQFRSGQFRRISMEGDVGPLISFKSWEELRHKGEAKHRLGGFGPGRFEFFWLQPEVLSTGNYYLGYCDLPIGDLPSGKDPILLETEPERGKDFCKREAQKCVREKLKPHVVLTDLTEAEIGKALDIIAQLITNDFDSLVMAGLVNLRFKVGSRVKKENKFFEHIAKEQMRGLIPQLRQLIESYCLISPDKNQLYWFRDEEHGAFMPALEALLQLDTNSQDMLRLYLYRADAEHELGAVETVFNRLHKRQSWKNEDIIRTGLCVSVFKYIGGYGSWDKYISDDEFFNSATALMPFSSLRELIKEEITHHGQWRKLTETEMCRIENEIENAFSAKDQTLNQSE